MIPRSFIMRQKDRRWRESEDKDGVVTERINKGKTRGWKDPGAVV